MLQELNSVGVGALASLAIRQELSDDRVTIGDFGQRLLIGVWDNNASRL